MSSNQEKEEREPAAPATESTLFSDELRTLYVAARGAQHALTVLKRWLQKAVVTTRDDPAYETAILENTQDGFIEVAARLKRLTDNSETAEVFALVSQHWEYIENALEQEDILARRVTNEHWGVQFYEFRFALGQPAGASDASETADVPPFSS